MMKDLFNKVMGKVVIPPHFEIAGKKVTSVGFPELEELNEEGYMIGEGMAMFGHSRGPLFIANTETKKILKLVDANSKVVGFSKDNIDYESLEGLEYTGDAYSMVVDYAGMGRYSDFHNGICCICWMLYPDGRYFADEDGFGMEDNDEVEIYCVIDKDFNVLRPFRPVGDVHALLNEVIREHNK